ncbi:MAG TPA: aminoacetone oxidase family FAD-binding enzyme [Spirochaetales bacterium]|nr:aminoacetone oxidase family FAD-binding enzyme [Spirochaetales bacterium]
MSVPERFAAVVAGGGPAGLFAAITLAEGLRARRARIDAGTGAAMAAAPAEAHPRGDGAAGDGGTGAAPAGPPPRVLVLERRERPARKLLLSGSGQCNLTHAGPMEDFLPRYGGGGKPGAAGRFLKPALYALANEDLLDWFRARGLGFEAEAGGKVFPATRRASSVLDLLLSECSRLGIVVATGRRLLSAERVGEGQSGGPGADGEGRAAADAAGAMRGPERAVAAGGFLLRAARTGPEGSGAEESYAAPLLLLATGGASYPATGSTGDGYALAKALGHSVVAPRPALAAVRAKGFRLEPLAGLSFRGAGLALRRGGKRVLAGEGDLLITHEGLSGPLVLDSSRGMEPGDTLELRFADVGLEEFRERFDRLLAKEPRRLARTVLAEAGLPKAMAELFCSLAGLAPETAAADLRRESREALCRLACECPVQVGSLSGWDEAMATAGGVDLAEVSPKTMESRVAPGLFFAGEVLDFDGDSGGYNLQAAFSTGALAGRAMLAALAGLAGGA